MVTKEFSAEVEELTETEAWQEIARSIESGEWGKRGLCREIHYLWHQHRIYTEVKQAMLARIDAELDKARLYLCYLFPVGEAAPRIALCDRFAKESAE